MLKEIRVKHLLLSAVAAFALIGCGEILEVEEDRPTPPADYENQGRYIDENVSGIEYLSKSGCQYIESNDSSHSEEECTQRVEGNTTADGIFGFIPGEYVYFSVAGLELDSVAPKYLMDGAIITVPQTNGRLASFLQSMDSDGNASNGIEIVPEVVAALKDLNVSGQYYYVGNQSLNIETLVGQVQEILDANAATDDSSDTTSPDQTIPTDSNDTTSPDQTIPTDSVPDSKLQRFEKPSVATLRYVDETEALAHLQSTISKHKPLPSITVEKVIEDIRDIADNAKTYTEEQIQAKVDAVRTQLQNPLEGDRGSRDILVAQALVDLSELTNEAYVGNLFSFNGTENQISQIIKEMALDYQDRTSSIVSFKDENATELIETGKKATLAVVSKLKLTSDKLGNALASVPQYYTFSYEDINISIDNIQILRATLLAMASKMSLAVAYDIGTDANYKSQTYTDTEGHKYQFTDVNIHQDVMLNTQGVGEATNQSSLTLAKRYLTESALLLKDLDAYSISMKDFNQTAEDEVPSDYQEMIDYGINLYKVLSEGNGTITVTNKEGGENGEGEEIEIAVNRLFDTKTAPKVSDFGTNWKYSCPTGFRIYTAEEAKKEDWVGCIPSSSEYNYSWFEAELNATTKPEAETSSLDELITKITIGGVVKTGQELIDYILDDGGSSSSPTSTTPEFTYEKVAGKTYYSVAENGDDAQIQTFSALGTNTVKLSPINETPENDTTFSIENGKLIIVSDNSRLEDTVLEENVNGLYDRYNYKFYYLGDLREEINYRAYYDKRQAEAYLGELRNFKYIGSDTSILTAPNGGESWTNGETRSIDWNATKISTPYVNLYVLQDTPDDLYLYDADVTTMLTNKNWYKLPSDSIGIYNEGSHYLDPADLNGTGDAYIILITDENNESWDMSDSTFGLNESNGGS